MRILYSSNSPWCPTGYGVQTAAVSHYLKQLGHDLAVFAFYGLEGSKCDMGDVPIYPNDPRDYGVQNCKIFYDDFKADILITHIDIWVLAGLDPNMNWIPRFPVDHYPVPPKVLEVLRNHPGIIASIVESKYGQKLLKEEGIDSFYIPPGVNTEVMKPDETARKEGRERYGWQDKFVIGMVATNHDERKNWTVAMKAVKILHDNHPGKVIFYMHTNPVDPRGINLLSLREALGMQEYSFLPSRQQMAVGIDRETLARTYNVFDVFLLPTKGEGACVPILEAEACGIPIITTKCTAHEENVGSGWFIEQLDPFWTLQNAWQFQCRTEEVVERLEQGYKAWEDGSIQAEKDKARQKALEFDEKVLFRDLWKPFLEGVEKKIKEPRNREGVQPWRLGFIPKTCIPRKVLDIGCGVTQPYRKNLEHLGEYIGIDTKNGENVTHMDAHHLTFEDKSFGFVWMSEVLEHSDNPEQMIAEAKRVGEHGVCLFSTPQNPFFKGDPDHKAVTTIPYVTLAGGDGLISW